MALITDYSQPSFYHFSRDSIELANCVAEHIEFHELVVDKVADLCCGCGVIGLEILQKLEEELLNSIKEIHFVEVQDDYNSHLHRNIEIVKREINGLEYQVHFENILQFNTVKDFDLIVMNPPYFKNGHGRSSENEKKRTCREYSGDELKSYIVHAANLLSQNGVLFFVCREDEQLKELLSGISKNYYIEKVEEAEGFSIFLLLRSKLH
ncbi:methyltransferase [Halobacteriovorax sp. YZS-1-1]|uniref:methyltransferase n=1 Tax=unclassified Halobacteriovorax TaxID=2639665 RepID=UPI0039996E39